MACCEFQDTKDLVLKDVTYWKPKKRNYPAVDAVISLACREWDACAVQMTVSHDHGIIRHHVEKVLIQLGISENHLNQQRKVFPLFFAVPKDKFREFPYQRYLTDKLDDVKSSQNSVENCVKQFALEVTFIRL
jgi:hypothetical protein